MELTKTDIGRIFSSNKTGDCFIVDNVTADSIYLRNETGTPYCSKTNVIDARLITDTKRIGQFKDNLALGTVLSAAHIAASRKLQNGVMHDSDALSVLNLINFHQHRLHENLQANRTAIVHTPERSLDEMIKKASSTSKPTHTSFIPFER